MRPILVARFHPTGISETFFQSDPGSGATTFWWVQRELPSLVSETHVEVPYKWNPSVYIKAFARQLQW
jgi:hypothetical protein